MEWLFFAMGLVIGNGIRIFYVLITEKDIPVFQGDDEIERLENEIKRIRKSND